VPSELWSAGSSAEYRVTRAIGCTMSLLFEYLVLIRQCSCCHPCLQHLPWPPLTQSCVGMRNCCSISKGMCTGSRLVATVISLRPYLLAHQSAGQAALPSSTGTIPGNDLASTTLSMSDAESVSPDSRHLLPLFERKRRLQSHNIVESIIPSQVSMPTLDAQVREVSPLQGPPSSVLQSPAV
jgi:hypothetical protein